MKGTFFMAVVLALGTATAGRLWAEGRVEAGAGSPGPGRGAVASPGAAGGGVSTVTETPSPVRVAPAPLWAGVFTGASGLWSGEAVAAPGEEGGFSGEGAGTEVGTGVWRAADTATGTGAGVWTTAGAAASTGAAMEDDTATATSAGTGVWLAAGTVTTTATGVATDAGAPADTGHKTWRRFCLKYLREEEFFPAFGRHFPEVETQWFPGRAEFFVLAGDDTAAAVAAYLAVWDTPAPTATVRLKYISAGEFFRGALPPSVRREELSDPGNGTTLFYTGTPERLALFLRDLAQIDRPRTRIRYDLFILQCQDSSRLSYGAALEARPSGPGDTTLVSGALGSLLGLNFDAVTVFGYQFAARLNAALEENQARVFADTTLVGISGETIRFQNTSTYRYRDAAVSASGVTTGVTREVTAGLELTLTGWASGDGMITIDVNAALSRRGAAARAGEPPETFEKTLTTQVRSRSGETIVLSGLRQNDTAIVEEKVPVLSKIPLLGWLFKNHAASREDTQMVIYLVPHIDLSSDEYTVEGRKTALLYERFVATWWDTVRAETAREAGKE